VAVIPPAVFPGPGLGIAGASRAGDRDLRPGILREDHPGLHIIAEAQRKGGVAAFIDAEHALDVIYAGSWGSGPRTCSSPSLIRRAGHGNRRILVRSNAIDVAVVDSVAALVPRSEIEGDMGDAQMGSQARLMSQALRKLTSAISKSMTSVIFITNPPQDRSDVRQPRDHHRGNALKFYASMRLDIRKMAAIKQGDEAIGVHARVKVVKNKLAPPFRERNSTSSTVRASPGKATCWTGHGSGTHQ